MSRYRADYRRRLYLHVGSRDKQRVIVLPPSLDHPIGNIVSIRQNPGCGCTETLPIERIGALPSIAQPSVLAIGRVCVLCRH